LREKLNSLIDQEGGTTWTLKWMDKGLDMLIEVKQFSPYTLSIFLLNFYPFSVAEFCATHMLSLISCSAKREEKRTPKIKPIKIYLKIINNK